MSASGGITDVMRGCCWRSSTQIAEAQKLARDFGNSAKNLAKNPCKNPPEKRPHLGPDTSRLSWVLARALNPSNRETHRGGGEFLQRGARADFCVSITDLTYDADTPRRRNDEV